MSNGERKKERKKEKHSSFVLIRQSTSIGYIKCCNHGVFDCSYPTSKLRRGRVQGGGKICPTITTSPENLVKIDILGDNMAEKTENKEVKKVEYAIRKLTPKECFRLMGVTETDADKMLAAESNSQCYKAAGNSIVVPVLMGIFSQLGIKGVKKWNDMSTEEKETIIYKGTVLEKKETDEMGFEVF